MLSDDDEQIEIKVNKEYAKKYKERKEKEELSKLKEKFKGKESESEEDSDEESEDEFGKKDKPEWDNKFFEIIPKIRNKDPEIYETKDFFPEEEGEEDEKEPKKAKEKNKKPLYLHDYLRKTLLETGGEEIDSDQETKEVKEKSSELSVVEEQTKLKKDLLSAVGNSDDEDDFLKLRVKSKEEKEKERKEYQEFKMKEDAKEKSKPVQSLDLLKNYWQAKELDSTEKFLREFILKKGWIANDDIPRYSDIVGEYDEDDDELLDKQDDFERTYNFRFEEEGATDIKTYPRTIEESIRRLPEKRKLKRQEVKTRKEAERKQKDEELKRLKNLKMKEIMERLQKLEDMTGTKAFDLEDLDKEYDPDDFDKKMQKAFSDDYYNGEEGENEKPVFSDDDDHIIEAEEPNLQEDDDDDGDDEEKKERKKKLSIFKQAKMKADSEKKEKLEEYLEEYYKLDYEDLVAGELPTRFKYTKVKPANYGFSVEEILTTEEKDLNKKLPVLKLLSYQQQPYSVKKQFNNYGKKEFHNNGKKQYNHNDKKRPHDWNQNQDKKPQSKKQKVQKAETKPQEQTPDPNKKTTIKERKKRIKMRKKMAQGLLPQE